MSWGGHTIWSGSTLISSKPPHLWQRVFSAGMTGSCMYHVPRTQLVIPHSGNLRAGPSPGLTCPTGTISSGPSLAGLLTMEETSWTSIASAG